MSEVIRYDYLYNEDGELQLEELPIGRFVYHSDYAALQARNNALEARIKQINVWYECDKCECLFIPGGKGSETTCATCIKEGLNALVEAVKKYFKSERLEILKRDARAEVDRLIANESAADCKGEG